MTLFNGHCAKTEKELQSVMRTYNSGKQTLSGEPRNTVLAVVKRLGVKESGKGHQWSQQRENIGEGSAAFF